jgi:AcrR family transcriptional regulator
MAMSPTTRDAVVPVLAEAFREHGYEGASMSVLQEASGLGRGSLYNFFPGGKEEMARAVLDDIRSWFAEHVFAPLRAAAGGDRASAQAGVAAMLDEVDDYFRSGRRICLQGAFALGRERDRFAETVGGYFSEWADALAAALGASGAPEPRALALRMLGAIQGGIVLARALDDAGAFAAALDDARRAARVEAQTRKD